MNPSPSIFPSISTELSQILRVRLLRPTNVHAQEIRKLLLELVTETRFFLHQDREIVMDLWGQIREHQPTVDFLLETSAAFKMYLAYAVGDNGHAKFCENLGTAIAAVTTTAAVPRNNAANSNVVGDKDLVDRLASAATLSSFALANGWYMVLLFLSIDSSSIEATA